MFLMSICFCLFGRFHFASHASTLNACFRAFFPHSRFTHGVAFTQDCWLIHFLSCILCKQGEYDTRTLLSDATKREIRRLSICRLNCKLHFCIYTRRQPREPITKTSHTDLCSSTMQQQKLLLDNKFCAVNFQAPIIISPIDCIKR